MTPKRVHPHQFILHCMLNLISVGAAGNFVNIAVNIRHGFPERGMVLILIQIIYEPRSEYQRAIITFSVLETRFSPSSGNTKKRCKY